MSNSNVSNINMTNSNMQVQSDIPALNERVPISSISNMQVQNDVSYATKVNVSSNDVRPKVSSIILERINFITNSLTNVKNYMNNKCQNLNSISSKMNNLIDVLTSTELQNYLVNIDNLSTDKNYDNKTDSVNAIILNLIMDANNNTKLTPIINILNVSDDLLNNLLLLDDNGISCLLNAFYSNALQMFPTDKPYSINDIFNNICTSSSNYRGLEVLTFMVSKQLTTAISALLTIFFNLNTLQINAINIIQDLIVSILKIIKKMLILLVKIGNYIDRNNCKNINLTKMSYNNYLLFKHTIKNYYNYVTILNNLKVKIDNINNNDSGDVLVDNIIKTTDLTPEKLILYDENNNNKFPIFLNTKTYFNKNADVTVKYQYVVIIVLIIVIIYLLYKNKKNKLSSS